MVASVSPVEMVLTPRSFPSGERRWKVLNRQEESGLVSEEIVPTASAVKQYAERDDT